MNYRTVGHLQLRHERSPVILARGKFGMIYASKLPDFGQEWDYLCVSIHCIPRKASKLSVRVGYALGRNGKFNWKCCSKSTWGDCFLAWWRLYRGAIRTCFDGFWNTSRQNRKITRNCDDQWVEYIESTFKILQRYFSSFFWLLLCEFPIGIRYGSMYCMSIDDWSVPKWFALKVMILLLRFDETFEEASWNFYVFDLFFEDTGPRVVSWNRGFTHQLFYVQMAYHGNFMFLT